jgi:rRNA biogenesis protein RRP5
MVVAKSGGGSDGAFPRGGGDTLAVVERKRLRLEAQAEAARDFAAEQELEAGSGAPTNKRRKGKSGNEADDDDLFSKNLVAPSKLPRRVDLLKFSSLTQGMRLLGIVSEVTAKDLIVALPHGLRGHVSAAEASDLLQERMQANAKAGVAPDTGLPSLSQLFAPGQHIVTTIIKLGDGDGAKARKRIELSARLKYTNAGLTPSSLKPGMVISACVKSVEDHGYTLSLAIKGASAFLRKASVDDEASSQQKKLVPGSLIDVIVTETKGKVSIVSSDPEEISGTVSKQWDGLTIDSLRPGAMVNARVAAVMKDGLSVSFLTFFSGTIDRLHLSKILVGDDWASKYSPGQKLLARILYVDPTSKIAGLSLARHLLDRVPAQLPPLGSVYADAVVRRVEQSVGLLLELHQQQPSTSSSKKSKAAPGAPAAAFVHVSNISEAQIKSLEKQFKPGQAVKARVIGHR